MEISDIDSLWDGKLLLVEQNGKLTFADVCRLCGSSDVNLMPIYEEEGLENDLQSKIDTYLPIQVIESDCLPHKICYQCATTLVTWHDLTVNCLKIDEKFHEILKSVENYDGVYVENVHCIKENEANINTSVASDENEILPVSSNNVKVHTAPSVKGTERFQSQQCQALAINKTGKEIMNSTLSLFNQDENDSIIISPSHLSCDPNSNNVEVKYYSVIVDKDNTNSLVSYSSEEQSEIMNSKSSATQKTGHVCVDSRNTTKSDNDLGTLPDNSLDNYFQLTLDHNYVLTDNVLPDNNSLQQSINSSSKTTYNVTQTPGAAFESLNSVSYFSIKPYAVKMKNLGNTVTCKVLRKQCVTNNTVQCEYCNQTFKNLAVLQTHSRFHAGFIPFYCKFCGKNFHLSSSLREHLKTCCDIKRKTEPFVKARKSNSGSKTEEINRQFTCQFCGKIYRLKASLRDHLRLHEGRARMKLKCEVCGEKFLKKAELMEHVLSHDIDVLTTCNICGKTFLNEKDLQEHNISHSNVRPFTCTDCGVAYKRKSHLTRHHLHHSQNMKEGCNPPVRRVPGETYKCEQCGRECRTKHLLTLHMVSHTGERNYPCYICGKRFGQSGAVTRHIHTVHGGAKDFICEVCNRRFTAKATKENHMRIHTGEKPFQCSQCGKTFRTQQQHKLHEKIHSDIRPYKCQYCEKRFRRRPHLIVHIRTHTGEKPYECPICSRGFAQKNDMNKHTKIHDKHV